MSVTIENIGAISYSSIADAGTQFRALNADSTEIGNALNLALQLSETKAYFLTRGILSTATSATDYETDARSMINWAKSGNSMQRQMVARAIRNDGGNSGNLFMVQSISEMNRTEAREFMKDYLASGGDTKAVTEWLSIAGQVLRKQQVKENGTAGFISDAVEWVGDKIEDAIDSISEAIEAIVDAIIDAGRSLVDIIGDVIDWAIEQVGDLVEALLEAGKSIAEILEAAWDYGVDAVKKFVKAVLDIGREIGEVLVYAVEQTAEILQVFVEALTNAAVSIGRILEWAAGQIRSIASKIVQTVIDIGNSIATILNSAFQIAVDIVGSVVRALIDIGRTIGELLITAITRPASLFREVVRALAEIGSTISELFNEVVGIVADGVNKMAKALIAIGKSIVDVVSWAINKGSEIIKDVIKAIIEAGKTVLDIFTDIASRAVGFIKKVVQALFDIGRTVLNLIKDVVLLGIDFARKFFTALTELATGLLKFAQEVIKLTYKAAAALVKTLLDVGLSVIEILGTVVGAGYLVLRRIINGIIRNLGPVGEILDWVLTQVEDTLSELWRDVLMAIRYANGKLTEAIDWAVSKGDAALEAILNAWESIEEDLIDFYKAAADLASAGVEKIFEYIGKATVKLENSVTYVLNYLEKDFIPGIRDFIKGVLDAGYDLAVLFINIVGLALQAFIEVIGACLDYGIVLSDLLIETMKNPSELLNNFMRAIDALGQTLQDIYRAVIIDTGEQFLEEVTLTLHNLGKAAKDILMAVTEVSLGAVAAVVSILLSTLASYRAMTAAEIAEARKIYGNTFDYSKIYFSQESLSNDIIFGLQDWASGESSSRAFVTSTLVNFDVNDGAIDYPTMIHELCHVWQFEDSGPFYMAEAIHAQAWGEGYNYGYTDGYNGEGGDDDLRDAFTDNPDLDDKEVFELFNREQQAEIIMHYYVRRYDESRPAAEYAAWQPFQNIVFS